MTSLYSLCTQLLERLREIMFRHEELTPLRKILSSVYYEY